jgi:hypothetical protein
LAGDRAFALVGRLGKAGVASPKTFDRANL